MRWPRARRSKPRRSRRFERCAEGPDGRWLDARQRRPARVPGSSTVVAYSYACTDGPGDLRGADRLNTARGTPRVWRTCGFALLIARTRATSEAQDFDKPRRREASRPVGPFGPLASRAPSVLSGRCGSSPKTTAYPAPQRNRAAELWLFEK